MNHRRSATARQIDAYFEPLLLEVTRHLHGARDPEAHEHSREELARLLTTRLALLPMDFRGAVVERLVTHGHQLQAGPSATEERDWLLQGLSTALISLAVPPQRGIPARLKTWTWPVARGATSSGAGQVYRRYALRRFRPR
ncbi:MAG: hypothetical protein ACO3JL_08150 [Myxococcota bacterium]